MMIRQSGALLLLGTVGVLLAAPWTAVFAASENYRASCANIRGNRLLFQDNDQGPANSNKRLTISDDQITGGRVEIVFSLKGQEAVFTEYGNENTGNALSSFQLINAGRSNDMIVFWGFDRQNGNANQITLYPKIGKAIWTTHNDRISYVDQLALSKSFMMDCVTKVLGD